MGFTASELDPLSSDPVPEGWDAFVADQRLVGWWDAGLLRAASWLSQSQSSMVLVRDGPGGEPVALFYARHLGVRDPRRYAVAGRVRALGLTECRLVPTMAKPGMAFASGLDPAGRRAVVLAFREALRGRAGARLHPVVFRAVPLAVLAAFPAGSRLLRRSHEMVLENRWPDVSAYLASLTGKWGTRIRKIHATVDEDAAVRVEVVDAVDPAEAVWLADTVRRRRGARWAVFAPYPGVYFDHLNRSPTWRYLTYRDRDGRLLAFTAVQDDGDSLHSAVWGYRPTVDGGRRDLYFDAYPRLVDMMITLGRRRVCLGFGMAELKARFGARPEPRYGVLVAGSAAGTGLTVPVDTGPARSDPARSTGPHAGPARSGRSRGSGRPQPAPACGQCGASSTVTLRRSGIRTVRYRCHRCGAVGRVAATTLPPVAARPDRAADDPAEVLPAPMLRWLRARSKRPVTLQRLDLGHLNELYRRWDAHVAELSPHQRAALAEPGRPVPTSGLPGFTAVVRALNATCYRSDLAVQRLAGPPEPGREEWRRAVWERVELARRWLALRGGDECWIRQVSADGLPAADPDAVAAVATALRTGARVDRAARTVLLAALFGTTQGPRTADLLAVYGADRLADALTAYLTSGSRPLREEALARLSAPLAVSAPPSP